MQILTKDEMREVIGRKALDIKNITSTDADALATLSPLVATKVLNQLTPNEVRKIIGKAPIEGGDVIAPSEDVTTPSAFKFSKETRDLIDYETFAKYGEPIENFTSIKRKKIMFSKQDFAIDKIDEAVLDLIRKTPKIDVDSIAKVLKIDKTKATDIIETLIAEELIDRNLKVTNIGKEYKTPSFTELVIRYKYDLRSDAPALVEGGESRDFCKAMMSNPRYFSREDINNIGNELGQLYDIPNYDAFRRRGGWYHDPDRDVNLPFCRHIWVQELVKRIK